MPDCEKLQTCIFFNGKMEEMPSFSEKIKKDYCKSNNTNCARYIVAVRLGKDKVPAGLFPHELSKAKKILEQNSVE